MKLYLVRWLHDAYYLSTAFQGGAPVCPKAPRLVRAFTDPVAAEQFRRGLESGRLDPPPEANPFQALLGRSFEGRWQTRLEDLTGLPLPVFCDWPRDADLEPPRPGNGDRPTGEEWARWWDEASPGMTPAQRGHLWRALDRVRFYEVVETELEG